MKKRAEILIDKSALISNLNTISEIAGKSRRIMAVVKAEAYGCGACRISEILREHNISDFAVASSDEAIALRKYGIQGNILVLGPVFTDEIKSVSENDITITISSLEYAKSIEAYGIDVKAHLKLDTGMHRFGIRAADTDSIKEIFNLKHINVCGIYTHLSASELNGEQERAFTLKQLSEFSNAVNYTKKLVHGECCVHALSSAGIMSYSEYGYDMVRIGIALFGAGVLSSFLKPVVTFRANTALIRNVSKGDYIGYGMDYRAPLGMKTAIVTAGYADGIPRNLSGKGFVLINGVKAPIIGKICMDSLTVDVSAVPDIREGDEAVIIGKSIGKNGTLTISADDIAKIAGTIPNEILSRLGGRLDRVVVECLH